ncbi:guanylate kinase [Wolbachia pipientis]|uniref:Guanylate kinase n=1 Tax=Wolbachia pipientis TaxID=955 RepID=A0A1E7QKH4_WOLPI|nr:guanylate kinase [Wolbachia pipientis]OEY86980.1 guanylate kinase [Wolbachia pipientis]
MDVESEGILLILSSPSGAGKTTISKRLLQESTNLVGSISFTTRKPRVKEIDGKDYFFVTKEQFNTLCLAGQMLEYAEVFGNFYGVPKDFIERSLENGISVLLNIDWQGAFHLFKIMTEKIVSVFILPPSMQELRLRLNKRNSESNSIIEHRLIQAKEEISKCYQYDYVIVNDDIDKSIKDILIILDAERLKVHRRTHLAKLLKSLSGL